MNIEHLKEGQEIRCIKDVADFVSGKWYRMHECLHRLNLGGWVISGDETDCTHFDLANPRTPIDMEKMIEDYQLMYKMLEGLSYEAKLYEHERYTIQQFLETVKID